MKSKIPEIILRILAITLALSGAYLGFLGTQGEIPYSIERNYLTIILSGAAAIVVLNGIAGQLKKTREKKTLDSE